MTKEERQGKLKAKLLQTLPQRFGQRTLLAIEFRPRVGDRFGHEESVAVVRCDCGRTSHISASSWKRGVGGVACYSCTAKKKSADHLCKLRDRMLEAQADPATADATEARRIALMMLPLAEDVHAQLFMRAFPDGATLDQVGDFYGLTRERVRQIEAKALRKLRCHLERHPELIDEHDPEQRRTFIGRALKSMTRRWDEVPTWDAA